MNNLRFAHRGLLAASSMWALRAAAIAITQGASANILDQDSNVLRDQDKADIQDES